MPPDETHNPRLRSWLAEANGHPDFPIQNLPLGIFSPPNGDPRPGIAIGDQILDLAAAGLTAPLTTLNTLLPQGQVLRQAVSTLLREGQKTRPELLHPATGCTLHLPCQIPNYTDFYAGIHHATNVGKLFRPDSPLLPNYKHIPIGYHGRASSIRPSGIPVRRPSGQTKQGTYEATKALDFELELGIWVSKENVLGTPIPIAEAQNHIAGYCLLNDWSARDLQSWEYQPLGPFLAKSFHTTISPWIITPQALAPFRQPQQPRPEGDPAPLPYLQNEDDQQNGALNLHLEALILTKTMRAAGLPPQRLTRTAAEHLYWTPAQLVTHHASNGCNLQPGDLLGTGTISGPPPGNSGSLLELTSRGASPITLDHGEQRNYLEDGDEIVLRAHAHREGFASIGFGDCRAIILASHS